MGFGLLVAIAADELQHERVRDLVEDTGGVAADVEGRTGWDRAFVRDGVLVDAPAASEVLAIANTVIIRCLLLTLRWVNFDWMI